MFGAKRQNDGEECWVTKNMEVISIFLQVRKKAPCTQGVTNILTRRCIEHKEGRGSVFTAEYNVHNLVYYEHYDRIQDAIVREKRVKEWKRAWTVKLIESMNPEWRDLYKDVVKL
jgi:putative endonuclease